MYLINVMHKKNFASNLVLGGVTAVIQCTVIIWSQSKRSPYWSGK